MALRGKAVALRPLTTLDLKTNMDKDDGKPIPVPSLPIKASLGSEIFSMEDGDEFAHADDTLLEPAVAKRVERLFSPDTPLEAALHRNVLYASRASGGCIYVMRDALARLGYTVRVAASAAASGRAAGSFYALRHRFLTVHIDSTTFFVDPSFRDHFVVANPTRRFAGVLSLVPEVAVAPPRARFLRAVTFLGMELARCFTALQVPLPPWRRLASLQSKWEGAVPEEGAPVAVAAPAAVPAALALPAKAVTGEKFIARSLSEMDSPSSVLEPGGPFAASPEKAVAAKTLRTVGFHIATPGNECFCCGLRNRWVRALGAHDFRAAWGSAPAA